MKQAATRQQDYIESCRLAAGQKGADLTAKEFLSQGWEIEKEIRTKEERIKRYRAMSESIDSASLSAFTTAKSKRNSGRYTDYIERTITLEEEICDQKARLMKVEWDISRVIASIGNRKYRIVLEMRYLLYKRWIDIADELAYSEKYVIYLHGRALKEVDKALLLLNSIPNGMLEVLN